VAHKKNLSGVFRFHNLAAIVLAAGFADMVWPFLFAAVWAFLVGGGRQGIMGTPHVAPGFGNFFLWDRHL
tara:strand:+ start:255 stop:464 length:210 start_codon:yes stop_codon:yes gene_type:complete